MICPNCNCELVDGTAVCPYCGTPMAAASPSADATATMPPIQQTPAAPAPAYRAEDVPVPATAPEAPQPAAHDYGAQAAYGRGEGAATPAAAQRDPYDDYYRQAPAPSSAPAYREPAPQPARDPYDDYHRSTPSRGGQEPAARDPYGTTPYPADAAPTGNMPHSPQPATRTRTITASPRHPRARRRTASPHPSRSATHTMTTATRPAQRIRTGTGAMDGARRPARTSAPRAATHAASRSSTRRPRRPASAASAPRRRPERRRA